APVADRLHFGEPPFEFGGVVDEVEQTGSDLLIPDYVQRLPVDPKLVPHSDEKTRLEALMGAFRSLAQACERALTLSAVGRPPNSKGQVAYAPHLNSPTPRGPSELEFAADDVATLIADESGDEPPPEPDGRPLVLKHEKCRNGPAVEKS